VRTLGSDALFPQNAYCLQCERGRSIFDQRHRFVTSAVYALPFGKGRRYMNQGLIGRLAGGWDLNSILTLGSGFPLNVVPGSDRSQTSTGYDRTNATGVSTKLDNPNPNQWFDISAFPLVPTGAFRFGNAGRNILDGPGFAEFNLSLFKNFYFERKGSLQFRWEVFNALNHANLNLPNINVNEPTGGTITASGTGRLMQFGLRYRF